MLLFVSASSIVFRCDCLADELYEGQQAYVLVVVFHFSLCEFFLFTVKTSSPTTWSRAISLASRCSCCVSDELVSYLALCLLIRSMVILKTEVFLMDLSYRGISLDGDCDFVKYQLAHTKRTQTRKMGNLKGLPCRLLW